MAALPSQGNWLWTSEKLRVPLISAELAEVDSCFTRGKERLRSTDWTDDRISRDGGGRALDQTGKTTDNSLQNDVATSCARPQNESP